MKILSRYWIHDNIHLCSINRGFSKKYFFSIIDYWKKVLLDNKAKPGQKIGFAVATIDISYIAAIFAALELGLKLTILLKPFNEKDTKSVKFNIYFPIDILILDRMAIKLFPELKNYYVSNSKTTIDLFKINYLFDVNANYNEDVYKIYPTPNDDCLLCTSSGSTGNPKLINHTHEFFYELCSFNWKPLEFIENDRVLHLVSFNHGSALGIYFLPSLKICKWHFFGIPNFSLTIFTEDNWNRFIDYCQRAKITKMQCPFDFSIDHMIAAFERSEKGCPDLTIYVLTFINPKWYNLVKQGKIKKIISIFGCSETSGPLFLPYVDKETTHYNPNNLGYPIEGFHKIDVIDGNLHVYIPTYDKTINTEDSLKLTDEGWHFSGKKKLYRINDKEINVYDVLSIIHTHVSDFHYKDATILVDELFNRLYAVTDNLEILKFTPVIKEEVLDFYNNQIQLEEIYYIENMNDFVTGIKPDREKLLNHIRQIKNEQD